jgi:manganese-dependent inorganic pyrophosphatase
MLDYLVPLGNIQDVTAYANQMFEAKSDLTCFSTREILLLDYKIYSFNNESWGIGTGETCKLHKMLERSDDLLKEMNEEKKKQNLKGILYCMIDIFNKKNITLIVGNDESEIVRGAFNVDIHDRMADLGSRISRKKQIIPTLEAYFRRLS